MNNLSSVYSAAIYSADRDTDQNLRAENIRSFGATNVWVVSVSPAALRRFGNPPAQRAGSIVLRKGPRGRDIAVLLLQSGTCQLRSLVGFENPTFTDLLAYCEQTGEVPVRLVCDESKASIKLRFVLDREVISKLRQHAPGPQPTAVNCTLDMAAVALSALDLNSYKSLLHTTKLVRSVKSVKTALVSAVFLHDTQVQAAKQSVAKGRDTSSQPLEDGVAGETLQ